MIRRSLLALGALLSAGLTAKSARAQYEPAPRPSPKEALELTVDGGVAHGIGRVASSTSASDLARRTGMGLTLDVAYRATPRWSFGVEGRYLELSNGRSASSRGFSSNVGATYHFTPYGLGDPFVRLGSGYRVFWEEHPGASEDITILRHGFQIASAKLGYDVRAWESIAVAPILGADLNVFVWEDSSRHPFAAPELGAFVYLGFQGRFDVGGRRVVPN